MIYGFDIETIRNDAMISRLPEPTADSRLKDPVKIAADIAEKKAEQVNKMALDPFTGRVLCVALVSEDEAGCPILEEATDDAERNLIQQVFSVIGRSDMRLVTWNGAGFDLPFLYKRALCLGVNPANFKCPPMSAWLQRYKNDRHIDLMLELAGYGKFLKLDAVASAILGERKTPEIDVTAFPEVMRTQEGRDIITEYCIQDTKMTYELFKRMQGVLFP
jgi:predicted PolB exonuclease-like 3'-5' exonuclease